MHICFVCTGNICRSPMAEKILVEHLRRAGLDGKVRVSSAGTGAWHVGQSADYRAAQTLSAAGYPTKHVAAMLDDEHLQADLLLALDSGHYRFLQRLLSSAGGTERIRMLRSFDPGAGSDLDVPDPYYGGNGGFTRVLSMIEASMPQLVDWIRANLGG